LALLFERSDGDEFVEQRLLGPTVDGRPFVAVDSFELRHFIQISSKL
jgi:hypothetical protein